MVNCLKPLGIVTECSLEKSYPVKMKNVCEVV
jgi:hypothetical protein